MYISPETNSSEWVNWEIEEAYRQEKIIVGVYEPGADGCEAPNSLYACADAIVKWDAKKIIAAINGQYKQIEKPDGTLCNHLQINRHVCG